MYFNGSIRKLVQDSQGFFETFNKELQGIDKAFGAAKADTRYMSQWDFHISQSNAQASLEKITKFVGAIEADSSAPLPEKLQKIPERTLERLLRAQAVLHEYAQLTSVGAKYLPTPYHDKVNKILQNRLQECATLITRFAEQGITKECEKGWHADIFNAGKALVQMHGLVWGISETTYRGQPIAEEKRAEYYPHVMDELNRLNALRNTRARPLSKTSKSILGTQQPQAIPQCQAHREHYPEAGVILDKLNGFFSQFDAKRAQKYTREEVMQAITIAELPSPAKNKP